MDEKPDRLLGMADSRTGAFLYSMRARGFFKTLFFKLMFLFTPKQVKLELAKKQVSNNLDIYLKMLCESESMYPIIYLDIMCGHIFILGSEGTPLAVQEFRRVLRKGRWERGLNHQDSPTVNELLEVYGLTPEQFEEKYG